MNAVFTCLRTCRSSFPIALLFALMFLLGAPAQSAPQTQWRLLWYNTTTGDLSYWEMDGITLVGSDVFARGVPTNWQPYTTLDLNGDGFRDILWESNTGWVTSWLQQGFSTIGYKYIQTGVPPQWQIAAAGDMNQDNVPDIIWQNTSTWNATYWTMNNGYVTGNGPLFTGLDNYLRIQGAADFTGDGKPELIVLYTGGYLAQGTLYYWPLGGQRFADFQRISDWDAIPWPWKVVATPDLNGDGKTDLIWQNTDTGEVAYWLMDGATRISYGLIATGIPSPWRIVGLL